MTKLIYQKHRSSHTKLYNIWRGIKDRCFNLNSKNYKYYGSRNITICEEWKNDFLKFKEWAENNGYKDDLTIERIDVNGNYCPENCKWATRKEQNNNKQNTKILTAFQETKSMLDWSKDYRCKVTYKVLKERIYKKWNIEQAITQDLKK